MSQRMIANWPRWFAAMWPNRQRRLQVISGYNHIPQDVLLDIALRCNVYAPILEPNDRLAAIAEGKRQMALELLSLAGVDARKLYDQSEALRPPRQKDQP